MHLEDKTGVSLLIRFLKAKTIFLNDFTKLLIFASFVINFMGYYLLSKGELLFSVLLFTTSLFFLLKAKENLKFWKGIQSSEDEIIKYFKKDKGV